MNLLDQVAESRVSRDLSACDLRRDTERRLENNFAGKMNKTLTKSILNHSFQICSSGSLTDKRQKNQGDR